MSNVKAKEYKDDLSVRQVSQNPRLKALGLFEITSSEVIVADPISRQDSWRSLTLRQAKTGLWRASVIVTEEGRGDTRVAMLIASHTDLQKSRSKKLYSLFRSPIAMMGVDSGYAGIFCLNHFRDPEHEAWFDHWGNSGDLTGFAGPHGVVSNSGFGDGSYQCQTLRDKAEDKLEAVAILFIPVKRNRRLHELVQQHCTSKQ